MLNSDPEAEPLPLKCDPLFIFNDTTAAQRASSDDNSDNKKRMLTRSLTQQECCSDVEQWEYMSVAPVLTPEKSTSQSKSKATKYLFHLKRPSHIFHESFLVVWASLTDGLSFSLLDSSTPGDKHKVCSLFGGGSKKSGKKYRTTV